MYSEFIHLFTSRLKMANDVTYKRYIVFSSSIKNYRMLAAMDSLLDQFTQSPSSLYSAFFQVPIDTLIFNQKTEQPEFFDKTLNAAQMDAIEFAMERKPIALIHGKLFIFYLPEFIF